MGLRLAQDKTRTVHIDDGFDFLGWHIQRHTQRGSNRRRVYTYPSTRAVKAVRSRIKALTGRQTINTAPDEIFTQLGMTLRGWTTYFRHGASKAAFSELEHYLWHRVWKWLRRRHRRRHWRWIVRTYAGPHNRWGFTADGVELFNPAAVPACVQPKTTTFIIRSSSGCVFQKKDFCVLRHHEHKKVPKIQKTCRGPQVFIVQLCPMAVK